METKYLIIGNGIAGLSAAKEIRSNDPEGLITMISSEPYLTYYRIKLTEALATKIDEDSLLVNKESWYKDKKIVVLLSKIVEKIDVDNAFVVLDDSSKIKYEKLLIATGSRPYIPPINGKYKEGVFALRTLKDLKVVQNYLQDCGTVTVIGGGLLGLEAAWSLKLLDKKVNVIEYSPHLLNRQLDKELGDKLTEKLMSEGINIFLPRSSEEIVGEEKVTGIRSTGGDLINTDAILISSGVRPNLDLVWDTTILFDKGIKVDNHLKTNIENIFAAGDVVEFNDMVIGLWTTSNEQGKIAGGNMSGKELVYSQPNLFSTLKIGDIQVFSAGSIIDYDRVYEYKDDEKDIHHKLFAKNGKIIGVILYGDLTEVNSLRSAVIKHSDVEEYLSNGISFK